MKARPENNEIKRNRHRGFVFRIFRVLKIVRNPLLRGQFESGRPVNEVTELRGGWIASSPATDPAKVAALPLLQVLFDPSPVIPEDL